MTVTPSSESNRSISLRGTAEPPHATSRNDDASTGFFSAYCSKSFHTVGTAPAKVGFSVAMSFANGSACRYRSGMIIDAPTMSAAYGNPQAFAWNIGTTGSTRSCPDNAIASPIHTAIERRYIERCEYATPFGLPVVPLVSHIAAASRSSMLGQLYDGAFAASSSSYDTIST